MVWAKHGSSVNNDVLDLQTHRFAAGMQQAWSTADRGNECSRKAFCKLSACSQAVGGTCASELQPALPHVLPAQWKRCGGL